jgi:hypothetical protein
MGCILSPLCGGDGVSAMQTLWVKCCPLAGSDCQRSRIILWIMFTDIDYLFKDMRSTRKRVVVARIANCGSTIHLCLFNSVCNRFNERAKAQPPAHEV